jgi:hypothetical protein
MQYIKGTDLENIKGIKGEAHPTEKGRGPSTPGTIVGGLSINAFSTGVRPAKHGQKGSREKSREMRIKYILNIY